MAEMVEYVLEVMIPGSSTEQWIKFITMDPFMPIHVGDTLEPRNWDGHDFPHQDRVLKVVHLRHIIFKKEDDQIRHLLRVFTGETENDVAAELET